MGLFKSKEDKFREETQEVVRAVKRGETPGYPNGDMVKEAKEANKREDKKKK